MSRKVRAKFYCEAVTNFNHGNSQQVKLSAVTGGYPEDNEFSKATPAGDLSMTVDNPEVNGFFYPGNTYYLDFTLVTE